ncbi:WXG100 family type VII secretion target [Nocardia brasiliensis]|uniref:WXG100 family type VII secretion target n=1 Tax=Nocardia brasiliensis TaxID=37326 RepID=UPI0036720A60
MRKLPRTAEGTAPRRTDPAYAPTVEIFDTMSHQEIYTKVQLLKPDVLAGGQQAWGESAAGLAEAVAQAHTEIRAAIADGWRGSGARNAAEAVHAFEQTGQDLADVLAVVSQRLGQASDAAEALRAAVSAPTGKAPDLGAALLDPTQATSNVADQKATEHSRQDIVRAMNDIYTGVFIPTGTDVPAFLDEQSGAAPSAPGGAAASKLTGTSLGAETSVPQPIPSEPAAAAAQPGNAVTNDAQVPADEQTAPDEQATTDEQSVEAAPSTLAATNGSADPANGGLLTSTPPQVTAAAATAAPSDMAPAAAPSSAATASTTTPAAAQPIVVPTTPGTAGPTTDDQRRRDERRRDTSSDAVTGLGAGAMGGLMGGALAMGDSSPRHGASVAANAANARPTRFDDEDDDFHFDDLPTFLEPADDNGELIGAIDPTTPPVLGEWTELE